MAGQFTDAGVLAAALREHFGLDSFRPLQSEIIREVLAGRPAVGILPTGAGKSLCYQLPALLLPGVTLVISPLISLMKDQVDALVARGIAAVAVNSQDTAAEGRRKLEALAAGQVKLAFVAPERLKNTAFLEACRRVPVSLLAVDEAHCVSQWGHDFRPDYRYIADFHAAIGAPPLLALTATARPEVRDDVMAHLGIPGAPVFSASADRANLWLGLEACATVAEKRGKVARLAAQAGGSTIVYVSSRKDAETLAVMLEQELGEPVAGYHAGLAPAERTAVQNRFMAGLCRVVVATNAFGMGIDKPDIRAVIHAGVPDSLEAYFQEVGRAGRDGEPSACTMVVVPGMDVKVREYLLNRENTVGPAVEAVFRQVQQLARHGGGTLPSAEDDALALLVVSHLQNQGSAELIQRGPEGLTLRVPAPLSAAVMGEVRLRLHEHERQRHERFRRMRQFVYLGAGCRREYLLQYFGESLPERPAACCSACAPRPLPAGLAVAPARSRKGRRQPVAAAPGGAGAAAVHPQAEAVLARLREWRRAKAMAMAVPAYVVFGDRDLAGIAAAAPRTLDELAACRGLGPVKLEQYGAELLAEVQAAMAAAPAAAAPAAIAGAEPGRPAAPAAEPGPRLRRDEALAQAAAHFAAGAAPPAVAGALGRAESTVWDYFLIWLAQDQTDAWKQAVRLVITPDDYRAIRRELLAQPDGRLRPVFDRLEGRFTYDQIRVARAVLGRVGNSA